MARRSLAQVIAEGDAIILAKNNEIDSLKAKHREELEVTRENSTEALKSKIKKYSDNIIKYKQNIDSLNYNIRSNLAYISELELNIKNKTNEIVKCNSKLINCYITIGVLLVCLLISIVVLSQ